MAVETKNVKSTQNNAKQEIKELAPSDVVATCTMTEAEHTARKDRIYSAQRKGNELMWSIMTELKSAKERKEQTLDGYGDTENDFIKWVGDLFEIKDTQVKQMSRIVGVYGTLADNGEWSIEPKFTRYTKEKLDIIQRHKDFKTKFDFDEIVSALGITPETSCANLKAIINRANGKAIEDKKEDDKLNPKTPKKEVTEKIVKESEVYKSLEDDKNRLERMHNTEKDVIGKILIVVNDAKKSDKDKVKEVKEIILNMSKPETK